MTIALGHADRERNTNKFGNGLKSSKKKKKSTWGNADTRAPGVIIAVMLSPR